MDILRSIGNAATQAGKAISNTAHKAVTVGWIAGEGRQVVNEGTALFQKATAPLQAVRRLVDPTIVYPNIIDKYSQATGQG